MGPKNDYTHIFIINFMIWEVVAQLHRISGIQGFLANFIVYLGAFIRYFL